MSGGGAGCLEYGLGPPGWSLPWGPPRCPSRHRLAPQPGQGSVEDRRTLRWGDYAGSWGGLQIKGLRSGSEAGGLAVVRRSSRSGQDCDLGASIRQPRGLALSSVQEPREVSLTGGPGAGSRVSPSPCDGEGGISLIHCGVASSPLALHLCPGLVKPRAGPRGAQRAGLAGGPCCPWVESGASWLSPRGARLCSMVSGCPRPWLTRCDFGAGPFLRCLPSGSVLSCCVRPSGPP